MGCSPLHRSVLEFERSWWLTPGPKDEAIVERFGMSAGEYAELLAELVDDDELLAVDPLLIRRLRRQRDRRLRDRVDRVRQARGAGS